MIPIPSWFYCGFIFLYKVIFYRSSLLTAIFQEQLYYKMDDVNKISQASSMTKKCCLHGKRI
jgi:hypothetical protein